MTATSLLVFAGALLVAVASPGPSVAALVARVLSRGVRDVLPFLAALWLGELIWLTAAVAGLSALAQGFGGLFALLKYCGIAYLLHLAWTMWSAPTLAAAAVAPVERRPWRMAGAGLMVTFGNPKNMMFYVALLPTIVDLGKAGFLGWGELCLTALAVLALVDLGWALAASRARRLLRSPRAVRMANRTSASMMAAAAVAIAAR